MTQEIVVLSGISGSGKTTKAIEMTKTGKYIRVNRDDIRNMLFGYTDETIGDYYTSPGIQHRESLVSKVQDKIIREAIRTKKSVVVDNTNLKLKHINVFKSYKLPVRHVLVDCDLKLAIQRDQARTRTVGKFVIWRQWGDLQKLKESGIFA